MLRVLKHNGMLSILTIVALLLAIVGLGRDDSIGEAHLTTAAYERDLVRWEIAHFPDKWLHLALGVFRDSPDAEERLELATEFVALRDDLRDRREMLERALAVSASASEIAALQAEAEALESRRAEIAPDVEETLEAVISQTVDDLGIIDRLGPVRWPPVDFTFESNGLLLVQSPRDEIVRLGDFLLEPDVDLLQQIALEEEVESLDPNISALVVRIGGVATYPAQVTPDASLHDLLRIASHEWLHHWLFFRPLGRAWFAGGELTSVNETVANIASEEISDRALERLTGEVFVREPWQPPQISERVEPDPDVFDFQREMRGTRTRLEELLTAGAVAEAEAYLEERRRVFVENGYNIRKLNTAWFAFHGTYADGPASISPLEAQIRSIRADSANLAEFLDRVAVIGEEGELEKVALEAGWMPTVDG